MFVQLRKAVGRRKPRITNIAKLMNTNKNSRDENIDPRALDTLDLE